MSLGTHPGHSRWKSYYRNKRILRIRSVVENPQYLPLRSNADRNRSRSNLFSSHTFVWLGLTIAFLLLYAGLLSGLARSLPQPAVTLLYGVGAFAAVESADWIWLRIYDEFEKFLFWVAAGAAVAIVAGLGLMALNPMAANVVAGNVKNRFEAWRQEKNEALQRANEIPVAFPTRGDDWVLLTRHRASGEVLLRAKRGEVEALCRNIGSGWRAPLDAKELRELRPHPQLPRSIYVWVGGTGAALEPSAERSGHAFVSGDPQTTTNLVLCLRRDP